MSVKKTFDHRRMSLILAPVVGVGLLAGCAGGTPDAEGTEPGAAQGFSMMVAQANDQDDAYSQIAAQYSEETGVEVEVIPYPSDAYNTQLTTQLQAGNAADVMVLSPGTGQPISVVPLAEDGFLEPLNETSSGVIPEGTEGLYEVDGSIYAQPTSLSPVGLIWNADAASSVGIDEFPATFDDMLDACATAREGGKNLLVVAGAAPPNAGLTAQLISATRVYEETPDWNQQRADGDVTFADSDWKQVLEDILTLNEQGCFQDGAAGGTFDTITANISQGLSLATAAPGAAAVSLGQAAGTQLTVQAFPPADGQGEYAVASANYAWAINSASDDARKEAAQKFLDWFAEPENSGAFAELFGTVPISDIKAEDLPPEYAPLGELLSGGQFTGLPNSTWPNPAVYEALGTGVQALLTGQKTVDQVLEEMDAAWG